jgi:lambda family phage portal protein
MAENVLDRFIAVFSPGSALRRANARYYLNEQRKYTKQLHDVERGYNAASKGRRTHGWWTSGSSINTENRDALWLLRSRSRDLQQNDYWARRAVKVVANHTVGTGIMPNFIGVSKAQKKKLQALYKAWMKKSNCDFEGQLNFYGLQKLVMRTIAISGECIIRKRRGFNPSGVVPLQLQVQEPDVIDTSRDGYFSDNGNQVVQGVEYDKSGKRIAYYLFDHHPGDNMSLNFVSKRVPASDVIHVFEVLRPGQVRGIPMGITAFIRIKDYGDYEDAQVVRQKIAACYSAFVTSNEQKSAFTGAGAKKAAEKAERIEPGMIEYLRPGETISFGTPPGVPEYSTFAKNVLLGISAAWDITYEALTGDLSGSNFSSNRMGWLEMARNVSDWQYQLMIPSFCDPVFDWFMEAATIGMLTKPGAVCVWTAPRREMFDPKKELEAIIIQIQAGLSSWSEAAREMGWDPEELLELIKSDQELMDKMGLQFTSDPRVAIKSPAPISDDDPDPEQDEKDEEEKEKPDPKKPQAGKSVRWFNLFRFQQGK